VAKAPIDMVQFSVSVSYIQRKSDRISQRNELAYPMNPPLFRLGCLQFCN
jgi:hypothetical protein